MFPANVSSPSFPARRWRGLKCSCRLQPGTVYSGVVPADEKGRKEQHHGMSGERLITYLEEVTL
jgi:hypothetical protein